MKGKGTALFLAVLYCGAFIAGFNENLMNMALMAIMGEYAVDSVTAQWLVTGYMIVATVVVMCMAFLYRRFKLRTLFFAAAGLTLVGSVMGLFASSFELLMAARLVQAAGSGVFIPLMMNTILVVTPKNKLGAYMSIGSCMITFGPALAPVVCGALVTAAGWHSIFLVPTVAMAMLIVGGAVLVKNLETSDAHLDTPSALLSAVFLTALSFGLAELTIMPLPAGIALALAALSAVAFVVRQTHCAFPLIDMEPMRFATFWPTIIMVIITMMTTFSLSVLLPLYLEGSLGLTALMAGIVMLVPVLGNAGTSLLGGRLMDKKGEWPLLPAGFAIILIGLAIMAATANSMSLAATFAGALVAYAGVGLAFSPSQTAGLRTLPPRLNPFGVALTTTFVQIAACIGPSMYIGLMSSAQAEALGGGASAQAGVAAGFTQAIVVACVVAGVGLVTSTTYALAAKRRAARSAEANRTADARRTKPPVLASIMETDPYTISATASMGDAMRELVARKVGGMPVVDERGRGVGYLSDGDVMRYLADQRPVATGAYALIEAVNGETVDDRLRELVKLPVGDVATDGLVTLRADASLKDACALLAQHKLKKVPVVEGERIIGTVNRSDVLRYAMETYLTADAASRTQ